MEKFDVKCPLCGAENSGLYLYETEGSFECKRCKMLTRIKKFVRPRQTPPPKNATDCCTN